jgi:MoxR-like ATPase
MSDRPTLNAGERRNEPQTLDDIDLHSDTAPPDDVLEARIPSREDPAVREYIQYDDEKDALRAELQHAATFGHPLRATLVGPTGTGKSALCRGLCAEEERPYYYTRMHDDMKPSKLITTLTVRDGNTIDIPGELLLCLQASHSETYQPVLQIDEGNRIDPRIFSTLMQAFDHQALVTIKHRGETVYRGRELGFDVIVTMNPNEDGYDNYGMDDAQARRLQRTQYRTSYFGLNKPDEEADLLHRQTDIAETIATAMVEQVANPIRRQAQTRAGTSADLDTDALMSGVADGDETDGVPEVSKGIPYPSLADWARVAQMYDAAGMESPLMRAAESTIIAGYSGTAQMNVRDTCRSIIGGYDGSLTDDDEYETYVAQTPDAQFNEDDAIEPGMPVVKCTDDTCGYMEIEGRAEAELLGYKCPECNSDCRVTTA